jgi:hypothetical protein
LDNSSLKTKKVSSFETSAGTKSGVMYYSYRALSHIQYTDEKMHIIKQNNADQYTVHDQYHPHMFRQQNTIFRESTNTKDCKYNFSKLIL